MSTSREEVRAMVLDQYQAMIDLKAKTIEGVVVGIRDDNDRMKFDALVENLEEELELEPADDEAPHDLTKLADWLHARIDA
ncbi:MAG: hypothetical protein AB7O24_30600 [Kofleriaceae bacterium]